MLLSSHSVKPSVEVKNELDSFPATQMTHKQGQTQDKYKDHKCHLCAIWEYAKTHISLEAAQEKTTQALEPQMWSSSSPAKKQAGLQHQTPAKVCLIQYSSRQPRDSLDPIG